MKPGNFYRIIVGAFMIISGIIAILRSAGEAIIGTMLLAAGLAFLITEISRYRKYGDDPESDERSKMIGMYGLSYAWLTGLFFMFCLFWLDYFNVLRLSTQNAISTSILVLTISAVIFQASHFRKGDADIWGIAPVQQRICMNRPNSRNQFLEIVCRPGSRNTAPA